MMKRNTNICAGMETRLQDLLLDPESVPAKVKAHVDGLRRLPRRARRTACYPGGDGRVAGAQANPYFMTRFEARLREEKAAAPAHWPERMLEKLRARRLLSSHSHMRPIAAMALTVMLLLGGGTYLDFYWQAPPAVPQKTAVVNDLQIMDNNAQLLDQLESISGDEN